jgi:hypothetical protein
LAAAAAGLGMLGGLGYIFVGAGCAGARGIVAARHLTRAAAAVLSCFRACTAHARLLILGRCQHHITTILVPQLLCQLLRWQPDVIFAGLFRTVAPGGCDDGPDPRRRFLLTGHDIYCTEFSLGGSQQARHHG